MTTISDAIAQKIKDIRQHERKCRGRGELLTYLEGKGDSLSTNERCWAKCYDCLNYCFEKNIIAN